LQCDLENIKSTQLFKVFTVRAKTTEFSKLSFVLILLNHRRWAQRAARDY